MVTEPLELSPYRGKGRAASPLRVGFIIKKTLMGELPLDTGELVNEAAITDLFKAYKAEKYRVNSLRPRDKHIRGMRYSSFYTAFKFAQLKGLVEFVREEEADFKRKTVVTPDNALLRAEKGPRGGARVVISNRKVFRITEVGVVDEKCWSDLTNSWKLNWPAGQKLEYIPPGLIPPAVPPPAPPRPPVERPVGFSPLVWKDTMTTAGMRALIKQLYVLRSLGLEFPGVREEVRKLGFHLPDWVIDGEDKLAEAESINFAEGIARWRSRIDWLNAAIEALEAHDLDEAIRLLELVLRS